MSLFSRDAVLLMPSPRLLFFVLTLIFSSCYAFSSPVSGQPLDDRGSQWRIVPDRGGHVWKTWALGSLGTGRLAYRLDLRLLSNATLVFETSFDIEKGWDFGFVQVSIDSGRTWMSIGDREGRVTLLHDIEAHYRIVGNLPGFTGRSSGWLQETFDLSRFTGNLVVVAFLYMTDWRVQGKGWMIDNVTIPELGFVDDAEHGPFLGVETVAPADSDSDGLYDFEEIQLGTDPKNSDTDSDGLTDGQEAKLHATDPKRPDSDDDGLGDGEEVRTYETNPVLPDTDSDGLSDGEETKSHQTNPKKPDTDGDGLVDGDEVNRFHTDPLEPDTDGDGVDDGTEIQKGRDPLKAEAGPLGAIGAVPSFLVAAGAPALIGLVAVGVLAAWGVVVRARRRRLGAVPIAKPHMREIAEPLRSEEPKKDQYEKLLSRLEELRERGEIGEEVYRKLRAEYEKKKRKTR